jgi:hypothetical protein
MTLTNFIRITLALLLLGIIFGKLPNPLGRFFEMDASMYHTIGAVLVASKSAPLQRELKHVLDEDGKLTQANMDRIWPIYMKSIPNGFQLPAPGAADLSTERQRLISQVAAHPQH